jgi:hypothetical protein
VIQGSVILKIEIPSWSTEKLIALAKGKDMRLINLGIRSIQLDSEPQIDLERTVQIVQKWKGLFGQRKAQELTEEPREILENIQNLRIELDRLRKLPELQYEPAGKKT